MEREELKGRQTPVEVVAHTGPLGRGLNDGTRMVYTSDTHSVVGGFKDPFLNDPIVATANAVLFAEAHNVANRTGMWPEDLVARIAQLESDIDALIEQS
jgi:hypothetical protein